MEEIILIADIHLTQDNSREKHEYIKQICLAPHPNAKEVVLMGDIFDSRKAQPLLPLNYFGIILKTLAERFEKIHIFPGNHDKLDYESEDSFLNQFEFHPKVNLIKDFGLIKLGRLPIILIPYFKEETTYLKYLNESQNSLNKFYSVEESNSLSEEKQVLLTHIGINGALNNKKNEVNNPIISSLFSSYIKVLIGHYHDRSQINDNIFYIGSLNPENWGEDNNKGYTILKADGSHKSITLKTFPKYLKKGWDLETDGRKEMEEFIETIDLKKDYWRFEFFGRFEKLKTFDVSWLEVLGIDCKTKRDKVERGITNAQEFEFHSFNKESIITEFDNFIKLVGPHNPERGINYIKKHLK